MFELGLTLLCITHLWPTFAHFLISFVTGLSVHSSLTKKTVWQINLKEWWLFSRTWVGPHSFSRCHCGFHKQSEFLSCSPESSLHYVLINGNSVKRGELVAIFISLHCKYSFQEILTIELWVPHSVTSLYRPFCLFAQMAADPFKVGEVSSQSSHREGSLDYMTMTIHWM